MDVFFLWLWLPKYGMIGYFASFLITHLLNFILSLRLLMKITKETLTFHIPAFSLAAAMAAVWGAGSFTAVPARMAVFLLLYGSLLCLFGVTGKADLVWMRGLVYKK